MCAEEGCKWEVFEQGVCRHHYRVGMKSGAVKRTQLAPVEICELPDCTRAGHGLRLCKSHYEELRKNGHKPDFEFDAEAKRVSRKVAAVCVRPGCSNRIHSEKRQLCAKHYADWVRSPPVEDGGIPCPSPGCGRMRLANSDVCKRCRQFKWRYSFTTEQVIDLFLPERRKCENTGCQSIIDLHMDHDHSCCPPGKFPQANKVSCGKCVRGWLCASCNKTLGAMQESPERIRGLLEFLERNGIN